MKDKNLLIVVATFAVVIIASTGLSVWANNGTPSIMSPNQQVLNVPQPNKGEAILFVGRVVDDSSSFRDFQPYTVDLQIITKYPLLQSSMREADSLFEKHIVLNKNLEPNTYREIAEPNPNYIDKIPVQLAIAILSDHDFHFIQLPIPFGAPDTNNYSTSVRVGNGVYSIGISYN